jgi:Mn-dependent DtxR family transcriptional regulator
MTSYHATASTSREAFRHLDTSSLHALILSLLREGGEWAIADVAEELHLERSTVSARLNELKHGGRLEYAGKKPSRRTGITSMHWKIKIQDSLF